MSIFAVPKQRFWIGSPGASPPPATEKERCRSGRSGEMRCTGNCTGGSNPSLSAAKIDYQSITEKAHRFTHTNVKAVCFSLF